MKVRILRASDDFEKIIDNVESIDDLKEILEKYKRNDDSGHYISDTNRVVLEFSDGTSYYTDKGIDLDVTIYDSYIE